ncbi:glycosyltransferase family 4 protein [Candidatus Chloroploca sp. Khr17]|uniref:glycosyltransferase family 4 protein n=1 Tax=Candidatus Chloroploca sp. Khr17 TaxID=2496869 RepID=UPI00101B6B29|nr:glycosyltransferase family 4 protein [Candidatus Chloroploca sp. Khr17]
MRILYIAAGIPVPGTLGGSTHAYEVARGLAQRGHTVHLLASSHEGWGGLAPFVRPVSLAADGFVLHQQDVPKTLSLLTLPTVLRLARAVQPDLIIERYYNFAGAGILAAHALGLPALLEVNALIVDPPEIAKRRLDDAFGGPLRRWAEWQCHHAAAIITPLHTTVPASIPRSKVIELPWGADVERFTAVAAQRAPRRSGRPRIVFMGSFRAWHGVTDVIRAGLLLLAQGYDLEIMLLGDGPERAAAEALAAPRASHFHFTGAVPYAQIPALLARADVGVAPFTTAPHPALRAAGFFWSPLKIYEYMAAGLPVVTTAIPPLTTVIREGEEGALFAEGDVAGFASAIRHVLADPVAAHAMGQRARARVVEHYSWQHHCAALEKISAGISGFA